MAEFYYTKATISIGGELGPYLVGATLNRSVETPDSTAMGAATVNRVTLAGGLHIYSIDAEFNNEYTNGTGVEALLDAGMSAATAVTLKPTGSGPTSGNPTIAGNFIVESYQPCQGNGGDLGRTTAHLVPAGQITWGRS